MQMVCTYSFDDFDVTLVSKSSLESAFYNDCRDLFFFVFFHESEPVCLGRFFSRRNCDFLVLRKMAFRWTLVGCLFISLTSYQLALFSACLSCESKHVPAFVLFSGEMLDTGVNRCKIKLFMFCLFCHILPSNYLCGCKFWQKYETKTNKHGQSTNDQQSTNIQKSPNINKYQISTRPGLLLLFFFLLHFSVARDLT